MSALPYMPLYVADYLADTAHLSALENGAYLMLIMNYWQRGKALPCGDAQLARIARLSLDEWQSVKPAISEFFQERGAEWVHGRIESELNKVREKSAKASSAGKASAQRKLNERSTDVEQTFNHTDTDTDTERKDMSETSSDAPQPERKKRGKGDYPPDFQKFYSEYPSDPGMSKPEALKAWLKLTGEDRDKALKAIPAFKVWVSKQGKDYRTVHACRYLSQRRFEGFDVAAAETPAAPVGVLVKTGTRAWEAWQAYSRATTGKSSPKSERHDGWYFPTEYPPELKPDPAELYEKLLLVQSARAA